jgi:DNA-binding response OmpR family regulator
VRSIFLFSHAPETSPIRDALQYGACRVETYALVDGHFSCPITAPPQLVILEPPPGTSVAPLLSAMRRHPVVGRVASMVVLDERWLAMAARMPCTEFVSRHAEPAEVIARVARLIGHDAEPRELPITSGALTIDQEGFEARAGDQVLALTPQEFALLRHLVKHPGRAWSREVLLARVWGQRYAGGTRTVDIHVRRLRAKLASPLADDLQTVRGVGYKWSGR